MRKNSFEKFIIVSALFFFVAILGCATSGGSSSTEPSVKVRVANHKSQAISVSISNTNYGSIDPATTTNYTEVGEGNGHTVSLDGEIITSFNCTDCIAKYTLNILTNGWSLILDDSQIPGFDNISGVEDVFLPSSEK